MATKTAPNPKAKKTDDKKKLLITAIKKTIKRNGTLPILETVYFDGKSAIVTDLETSVIVPYKTDIDICVPANKVIDILEIADNPVFEKTPPTKVPRPTMEIEGKLYYIPLEPGTLKDLYVSRTEEENDLTLDQYVQKHMPEAVEPFETYETDNYGVQVQDGKRKIKVTGDGAHNFPKIPMYNAGDTEGQVGRFTAETMSMLEEALCFVSKDDLRPAMTGVYFEEKKGKKSMIVSTDAHRMFFNKIEPIMESFILPEKTAKILLSFGGEWELTTDGDFYICFFREDGLKIVTRTIDARFPDFRVVIPQGEPNVKLFADPSFLLKELKNAAKFANKTTKQVNIHLNGVCTLSSQEVDFGEEYVTEMEGAEIGFNPDWDPGYLFEGKPVVIKEDLGAVVKIRKPDSFSDIEITRDALTKAPKELLIAFNSGFLQEIVHKIAAVPEPVEFHLWAPSKATIINGRYLVMPLMINS